ncbi:type II toxin-antitoxin system HipA family toxin [Yersinia alsatica]|uniref:type II toxin-antitoxin system HipA family toxin n=1 Tax=Yersinia alsatica TaxID=2890317 RepID=UPI002E26E2F8
MMTSDSEYKEAYAWIWLPGETKPIVAGLLSLEGKSIVFNYGKSYLERINDEPRAIPIYEPELPLKAGILPLLPSLSMPGCLRDSAPDAWGRRVIINRKLGKKAADMDTAIFDELTYLLESGSDRIGALDYQRSPTVYEPRSANNVSIEELMNSVERVENGIPLTPELDQALYHGSSIGGARPKALIEEYGEKYIAKFSASSDLYSVVKAEYIAMRLAALAGLNVAPVRLLKAAGKDVLLIKRFDRDYTQQGWTRRLMVSALTLFGLDDMFARYASYEVLAEIIRTRFQHPKATLKELFSRLCFNVLCGNTDDHARNHAAFWDGNSLVLTPAYDICPQGRSGNEASQAMLIVGNERLSTRSNCLAAAPAFLLTAQEAKDIFEQQKTVIEDNWQSICDEAELSEIDRKLFWHRQFLNPFSI